VPSEHAAREASALPRHIGGFTAGCVLVSTVVGSGIFTTTGFMARDLAPPSQGSHEIHFQAVTDLGFTLDVKYVRTVLRCGKVDKSLIVVSWAPRGGAPWRPSS
jgi:hypothetical protein